MTEHYKVKLDPDQMGSLIDQLAPDLDEQTEQTATLHDIRDQVRRIADMQESALTKQKPKRAWTGSAIRPESDVDRDRDHRRACDDDPDEALERNLYDAYEDDEYGPPARRFNEETREVRADWFRVARAAREHIESGWEAKCRQADDLLSRTRDERDDLSNRLADAESWEPEVERLNRERDEAERRRIVGDMRIRQLVSQVEMKRAKYDDLLDRIRVAHKVAAFHAEMLQSGDPNHRDCAAHSAETLADLLPEDEQ